jgi:2-C-methyl-D-erythritol 4-phosphate cytidylyltransferase
MAANLSWAAVIVAAGRGTRLGRPKQFLELAGMPMVGWSVQTFATMAEIDELVVVTEPEWFDATRDLIAQLAPRQSAGIVRGGETRQASVHNGLRGLSGRCNAVLVHDGARPLVRETDVRAGMQNVRSGRGAFLATPVVDTIKVVDRQSGRVLTTLERETLWAAQTPQFATAADMLLAHEIAAHDGCIATDDAALLERIGIEVVAVASTAENFKVTQPEDIARAEAFLRERVRS